MTRGTMSRRRKNAARFLKFSVLWIIKVSSVLTKKEGKTNIFVSRNALTELTGAKLVHFMSKDNNIYCY